jgi:hypothetical protein
MERAFDAGFGYWGIRSDVTIGGFAYRFLLVARFCVVSFVKIGDV